MPRSSSLDLKEACLYNYVVLPRAEGPVYVSMLERNPPALRMTLPMRFW